MESGQPSVDQVAPLDNKAPARHIYRVVVGAKTHRVRQDYSWRSSPCHEERCNGDAASLVSAPCGLSVQAARR